MLLLLLLLDLPQGPVEESEAQRYPITNWKPPSKEGAWKRPISDLVVQGTPGSRDEKPPCWHAAGYGSGILLLARQLPFPEYLHDWLPRGQSLVPFQRDPRQVKVTSWAMS